MNILKDREKPKNLKEILYFLDTNLTQIKAIQINSLLSHK